MGSLFKKKSSTSKETTNSEQKNLLAQNKDFMNTFNQANREMSTAALQPYQLAEYSQQFNQAQANLLKGVSTGDLEAAQTYMQNLGQSQLTQGLQGQSSAQGMLSRIANMTTEDYQKGFASEFNSQLVKDQISAATEDINAQRDQAIFDLNQNATASGNMGSSRSGIAQGVIVGQAARAVGQASVQYRTAEEQNAQNRYMSYLGMQQNSATSLASLAQNQISTGYSAYNQGVSYGTQRNALWLQNQQNAYNVGLQQQQRQQSILDINRQNAFMLQSPALARLQQYGGIVAPFGSAGSVGTSTKTTVTPGQSSIFGGLMGAAGAAVGAFYGGPEGAAVGGSLGGSLGNSF
ncbi:hypothetical protein OL383_004430 [Salmonella enterica]|nr:hypothetical protein [Salmonella enterica]